METRRIGRLTKGCIFFVQGISIIALILAAEVRAEFYSFRGEDGFAYFTNVPGAGRIKVGVQLTKELSISGSPIRSVNTARTVELSYDPIIISAGEQLSVDPDLIRAVIKAESNFDSRAVSPKGAQGLMQIMPLTARELGIADPFDPAENVRGGVRYLRSLLDTFNGDYSLALAAYNAGPSRVLNKRGIPAIPETQLYVKQVLEYLQRFKN
jgi:soluble lytic murein transglycosylase-like protein